MKAEQARFVQELLVRANEHARILAACARSRSTGTTSRARRIASS